MSGGEWLAGGDLALIRTLQTEPSEWGRTRLSAKVVRTVRCAEGASPDSEPHFAPTLRCLAGIECGRGAS